MMPNFSTPAGTAAKHKDCQDTCPPETRDNCQQGRNCPYHAERAAARLAALPRWARRVVCMLSPDASDKAGR
jgi:hypothetical protein